VVRAGALTPQQSIVEQTDNYSMTPAHSEPIGILLSTLRQMGARFELTDGGLEYIGPRKKCEAAKQLLNRQEELTLFLRAKLACKPPRFEATDRALLPSIAQEMWWRWIDEETTVALSLLDYYLEVTSEQLTGAILKLADAHMALRSSFAEAEGALRVTLNSTEDFVVEKQCVPEGSANSAASDAVREFLARPLLASSMWLTRAKIVSLSSSRHLVVMAMNHLIVDGPSIRILKKQLRGIMCGTSAQCVAPGKYSLSDFVNWQLNWYATARARFGCLLAELDEIEGAAAIANDRQHSRLAGRE